MSNTEISDAEAHALVLKRFETMTHEEAQGWLDHIAKVFGTTDATSAKSPQNTPRLKTSTAPKKSPRKTAAKVAAG